MKRIYLHRDESGSPVSIHELNRDQIYPAFRKNQGFATRAFVDVIKSLPDSDRYFQICDWHPDVPYQEKGLYLIHYGSIQAMLGNQGFVTLPAAIRDQIEQGILDLLVVFVWETFDTDDTVSSWQKKFCTLLTELCITRRRSVKVWLGSHGPSISLHEDDRVDWVCYNFFEAAVQVQARQNLNCAPVQDFSRPRQYRYISLNRSPRTHRLIMTAYLEYLMISHRGFVSWPACHDRHFPVFSFPNTFSIGIKKYPDFAHHLTATKKLVSDYHDSNDGGSDWLSVQQFYQNSDFEIINETHFHNIGDLTFLTEKTFRALCLGMPFVLLANPGDLKFLQSLGYETFSTLFDENYNNNLCPIGYIKELAQQVAHACDRTSIFTQPVIDAVVHNQQHFWSRQHAAQISQSLNDQSKT